MNRFARAALAAAVFVFSGAAPAKDFALSPVEPAAIAAAALSCSNALSTQGVDEKRLAAEGWQRASISAPGKAADSSLRIYARGNVVLLLTPEPIKGVVDDCYLTARIASAEVYARVVAATQSALGGRVIKEDKGTVSWMLAEQKAAQISPTGSASAPAVRLTVVTVSKEK